MIIALGSAGMLYALHALLSATGSAQRTAGFNSVVLPFLVTLALTLALEVLQTCEIERSRILGELVSRRSVDKILDVAAVVNLESFDEPAFYDHLRRAQVQGQTRSLQVAQGLLRFVGSLTGSIAIVAVLSTLQPYLLPAVVLGYVPLWVVSKSNSRDLYAFGYEMTTNDRERMYVQQLLLTRGPAKEVRAYDLAAFLRRRYDALYELRLAALRALARRRVKRGLVGSLGSSGGLAFAVLTIAWLYIHQDLSGAGACTAGYGLFRLGGGLQGIQSGASTLYEALIFIADYEAFLRLGRPARIATREVPPEFRSLTLDAASFTYPGSSQPALREATLEIHAGEIIALVGENGSGKTTLAKLLAGLYAPTHGQILWNGTDVSQYEPELLREHIAVVFQDFERYRLPAGMNIGLGRCRYASDQSRILSAAEQAQAHRFLQGLPDGYETRLGPEFLGGVDLSIGQWQRIALARAMFRDAPIVILDEPTAALDARAEAEFFTRMSELISGKTTVLISHRLTSVRSADCVYVLADGRIVERGTHNELLSKDGLYAELYGLQTVSPSHGKRELMPVS